VAIKKIKKPQSGSIVQLTKCATGITGLDEITNGGFPKGRATLICGNAGAGKTLLATEFLIRGATQYNEPGLFFSFEETENELILNVSSLGFNLTKLIEQKKIAVAHLHVDHVDLAPKKRTLN
jgi:circadian clock protein KaiC